MIYLLGGYMWLYVHRPFEVWPALGTLQVERGYMLLTILVWLVHPGKGLMVNRLHAALLLFALALGGAYLLSPYADSPGCYEVVDNFAKVAVFYVLVTTTVRDDTELQNLIRDAYSGWLRIGVPETPMVLDAAEMVPWQDVMGVINLAKREKMEKFEFAAGRVCEAKR